MYWQLVREINLYRYCLPTQRCARVQHSIRLWPSLFPAVPHKVSFLPENKEIAPGRKKEKSTKTQLSLPNLWLLSEKTLCIFGAESLRFWTKS